MEFLQPRRQDREEAACCGRLVPASQETQGVAREQETDEGLRQGLRQGRSEAKDFEWLDGGTQEGLPRDRSPASGTCVTQSGGVFPGGRSRCRLFLKSRALWSRRFIEPRLASFLAAIPPVQCARQEPVTEVWLPSCTGATSRSTRARRVTCGGSRLQVSELTGPSLGWVEFTEG